MTIVITHFCILELWTSHDWCSEVNHVNFRVHTRVTWGSKSISTGLWLWDLKQDMELKLQFSYLNPGKIVVSWGLNDYISPEVLTKDNMQCLFNTQSKSKWKTATQRWFKQNQGVNYIDFIFAMWSPAFSRGRRGQMMTRTLYSAVWPKYQVYKLWVIWHWATHLL
jgi:hypothetical protein